MPIIEWLIIGFCAAIVLELLGITICLIKMCHSSTKTKEELAKLVAKLPLTFEKSEWPKKFWDWLHHIESKHLDKPCEETPKKLES
jgi:hypothetical protein